MLKFTVATLVGIAVAASAVAPAAALSGQELSNDLTRCTNGDGPAFFVNVTGFEGVTGIVRVQTYPATKEAWLAKGKWITRVEAPARVANGIMQLCLPVPAAGTYGIAVRHDRNGNGKTDFTQDGGGFSNNPKISLFNLGKPSVAKVAVRTGHSVTPVTIKLQYM